MKIINTTPRARALRAFHRSMSILRDLRSQLGQDISAYDYISLHYGEKLVRQLRYHHTSQCRGYQRSGVYSLMP